MTDPLEPLRQRGGRRGPPPACAASCGPALPTTTLLDLASNDYLGLARDPRVTGAAAEAAPRWGAGSTGSRLVTGHHRPARRPRGRTSPTSSARAAGAGLLLRLPGQPRRGHGAGRRRRAGRVRRAEPRLAGRRLPAGARRRRRRRRTGTSTPSTAALADRDDRAGRGRHRRGVLRRRRPRAAGRAARGRPARTARCSSSTRRTGSASSGRTARGGRGRGGHRRRARRRAHR